MLRLTICCLVLGAALAKPTEKLLNDHAASKTKTLHSQKTAFEVDSKSLSEDPLPLPEPITNSTNLRSASSPISYFLLSPGSSYYFTSPNYPSNYNNNDYFAYYFQSSNNKDMQVYCDPFDVEDEPTCSYDWLKIEGTKYCGSGTFTVFGCRLLVEFCSDNSVTRPGFYCLIAVPT